MTSVESRLRETFASIDRQITVEPLDLGDRAHRRPTRWLGAAAAAVAIAVGAVTFAVVRDDDRAVVSGAHTAEDFVATADAACVDFRHSSVVPRFATLDAYRTAAENRIERVDILRSVLVSLRPPADAPDVIDVVTGRLDASEERARHVLELVELERLDAVGASWNASNEYMARAFEALAEQGAKECQL
jgi:hypothetical protein